MTSADAAIEAPVIATRDVHRRYQLEGGAPPVHALRGVTFAIAAGEHVAIIGPSGSGKSTLLNLLGALDRPDDGVVAFNGRDVRSMDDRELAELRNRRIGFVFQSFQLLTRMTAESNVGLPLVYAGLGRAERRRRAMAALAAVGLDDRADHRPGQLSGGQQQRVAIARALVTEPEILLADEPTGNLDTQTGHEVMELLEGLHHERGMALITITHDPEVAGRAPRRIEIRDGQITADDQAATP